MTMDRLIERVSELGRVFEIPEWPSQGESPLVIDSVKERWAHLPSGIVYLWREHGALDQEEGFRLLSQFLGYAAWRLASQASSQGAPENAEEYSIAHWRLVSPTEILVDSEERPGELGLPEETLIIGRLAGGEPVLVRETGEVSVYFFKDDEMIPIASSFASLVERALQAAESTKVVENFHEGKCLLVEEAWLNLDQDEWRSWTEAGPDFGEESVQRAFKSRGGDGRL